VPSVTRVVTAATYESVISASRIGIVGVYGPGGRPAIGYPMTTWSKTSMWS
jgi:hypothetical protein